jgi:hypothetical protein
MYDAAFNEPYSEFRGNESLLQPKYFFHSQVKHFVRRYVSVCSSLCLNAGFVVPCQIVAAVLGIFDSTTNLDTRLEV